MGTKPLRASYLFVLVLTAKLLAAGNVGAEEITLSVLGLEPAAGAPDSVAAAVTEALRQRATSTPNYRLVPGRDLVEVKLIFSCPDEAPACMTQAAQSIGASKLVFGNVQPIGTDAYLITLKILDAGRGIVESWISEQITKPQTSPVALRVPVQKWFATLTGQALPGTLKITGGVVGATVLLDGVQAGLIGTDGLTIAGIAAGPHQIVVSRVGYEKFERNVTMASGTSEKLVVQLESIDHPALGSEAAAAPGASEAEQEAPPVAAEPVNQASRVAAWALLGTSLVAIGLGGYSSYKVSGINSDLDPFRRYTCKTGGQNCGADGSAKEPLSDKEKAEVSRLRQSGDNWAAVQWVGYGLGAALLVTSAIFMYEGYISGPSTSTANRKRPSLIVMPSFGPGSAGGTAYLIF